MLRRHWRFHIDLLNLDCTILSYMPLSLYCFWVLLSHVSVDWLANIMLLNMNEKRFLRTSVCWLVRHNKSYKRREYDERTFLRDWALKCMGNFDKLLLAKPVNTKIKLSCKTPIWDPIIFFCLYAGSLFCSF